MKIEELAPNVLIIDDHPMYAMGLKVLLETKRVSPNVQIFSNSDELLNALKLERYALVIADQVLGVGTMTGIELLCEIKSIYPGIKCILMSSSKDVKLLGICKENSIDGYIFKSESEDVTLGGIQSILSGNTFYSEIQAAGTPPTKSKFSFNPFLNLTRQEIQIIKLLAKGMSQKEMADQLNISLRTVNVHKANISKKMNKAPDARIIHEAFLWGIVEDSDLV